MKQGSNLYSSPDFSLALLIANIFQDETVNSLFRDCLYNFVSSRIKAKLRVAHCFSLFEAQLKFEIF
jgi:hypothetical protein